VEQRIGRVDRVGQNRDVHVLVPCFKSGFEAAVLKVMQESIGVLDQTVGGIDHALEYVSDRLAGLILTGAGADAWKGLYRETRTLVTETRERIESSADPILDHASFDPARVEALMARVPNDLEEQIERFVRGYASHSKLDVHTKSGGVVGIEGAPGAAGGAEVDSAYAATFSRLHALDHEDTELLSFGHPLVEQAMEWAETGADASAALALRRGCEQEGAIFLWRFCLDLPDDVPEAGAYFDSGVFTFALDESGKRVAPFEGMLDDDKPLDRMDPAPLRAAVERWRRLVQQNYEAAEPLAEKAVESASGEALARLEVSLTSRRRHLDRQLERILQGSSGKDLRARGQADHAQAVSALEAEGQRLRVAIEYARPRLHGAAAVRLVKTRRVSG
jgi:ATP-dependent helicase HepA